MKFSKVISLVLIISILATLLVIPVNIAAAEEGVTTLINMFSDTDCNNASNIGNDGNYWITTVKSEDVDGDGNNWYTASTIGQTMVSGSTQRSTGMYLKLSDDNKILANHKYVLNFKGKSLGGAETINLTIGLGGGYKQIDVSSTARDCSFTIDATSDANMIAIAATNKGVVYKYAIDNVSLYDITNAHEIIADENITILPEYYITIGDKKMTNAGDKVSFTVEVPHGSVVKSVSVGDTIVEPGADGKTYSFTMPGNDVSITTETELVGTTLINMFSDPDFEKGLEYADSLNGAGTLSIVNEDGVNWVKAEKGGSGDRAKLAFILKNAGGTSWANTLLKKGNKYNVSFKAKASGGNAYWLYYGDYSTTFKPSVTPNYSSDYTPGQDECIYIRASVAANDYIQLTGLYIYDITNAHEIIADENVTILPEYYTTIGDKKMTNAEDKVSFTLKQGVVNPTVTLNNETVLTPDADGVYKFTMPNGNASISVTETGVTTLTNMFPDPDCNNASNIGNDGSYWITTVKSEDVDGDGNNWYTASTIGQTMVSGTTQRSTGMYLKLSDDNKILANHKYVLNFKGKSLGGAETINLVIGLGDYPWRDISETAKDCSCTIDAASDATMFAIAATPPGVEYKYAIDNVSLYDITNAKEIEADDAVIFGEKACATIDGKKMTNVGDDVRFTVSSDVSFAKVLLNGEEIQAQDGIYKFTMTEEGATIKVVDYVDSIAYYINQDGSVFAGAQEAGTRTVIVGIFEDDYMVNAEILEFNTTGKEERTLNPEILKNDGAAGYTVRLFTWDNLNNIKPLRALYEQVIAN